MFQATLLAEDQIRSRFRSSDLVAARLDLRAGPFFFFFFFFIGWVQNPVELVLLPGSKKVGFPSR